MSNENKITNRRKFEDEIVLKAWNDSEFKKKLLGSPKEVIQEEMRKVNSELKLPDDLQVFVHEETPKAFHMTLPLNPADIDEDSLANVAGGGNADYWWIRT